MLKKFKIIPEIISRPVHSKKNSEKPKNSQILKSTRGYALSTNGGGEFLDVLIKNYRGAGWKQKTAHIQRDMLSLTDLFSIW